MTHKERPKFKFYALHKAHIAGIIAGMYSDMVKPSFCIKDGCYLVRVNSIPSRHAKIKQSCIRLLVYDGYCYFEGRLNQTADKVKFSLWSFNCLPIKLTNKEWLVLKKNRHCLSNRWKLFVDSYFIGQSCFKETRRLKNERFKERVPRLK